MIVEGRCLFTRISNFQGGRDEVFPGYRGLLQVITVTSRGLQQGLLAQEVLAGGSASSIPKLTGRKVVPKPD